MKVKILLCALALGVSLWAGAVERFDLAADLSALDETLSRSAEYQAAHERRLFALERELASGRVITLQERYDTYGEIYRLAYPYQYDRAMEALNNQE